MLKISLLFHSLSSSHYAKISYSEILGFVTIKLIIIITRKAKVSRILVDLKLKFTIRSIEI